MLPRPLPAAALLCLALRSPAAEPVAAALPDAATFDGTSGVELADRPELQGQLGVVLSCWVNPSEPAGPARNVVTKPDEYMLRIDPAAAGGQLAFYVMTAGEVWEPRVRGPVLEPGMWHRVVAAWDRRTLRLWVDRRAYTVARSGHCRPAGQPLLIGGPGERLAGFVGQLREVALYRVPDRAGLLRLVYGLPETVRQGRGLPTLPLQAEAELWQAGPGTTLDWRDDELRARLAPETGFVFADGLAIDAAAAPRITLRLAAQGARRAVLTVLGSDLVREFPIPLRADGEPRWHTIDAAAHGPWSGRLETILLHLEAAAPTTLRLQRIDLAANSAAPGELALEALAPERRVGRVGWPMPVTAWVANHGGETPQATVSLTASEGIRLLTDATVAVGALHFGGRAEAGWQIVADQPCDGEVTAVVTAEGRTCRMVRPVRFSATPEQDGLAMARGRVWQQAGYPRAMDFRHLGPDSVAYLSPNTAFLVDFIGQKIPAARELKERYPDRLVLMQVNDEVNGIWGSWHVVPREFAAKEGLACDEAIFPMPSFRGWWLLGPPARLDADFAAAAETVTVRVPDVGEFLYGAYGKEFTRDVMLYGLRDGRPDWATAEYASLASYDKDKSTITLQRWPREAVGDWHGFGAGEAMVAPSVGSIYGLRGGPTIKTWIPNLTPHCPRDAEGRTASEWWITHFAKLWHERIAPTEPHPDGFQFDGLAERPEADCDLDGTMDGCQIGGHNLWKEGLHRFFAELRRAIPDALVLADASNVWGSRSLGVLHGSENEEYPSFLGPDFHASGFDLYRVWSRFAQPPHASYVQGRFHCDTYLEDDGATAREKGAWYPDSLVRMSLAGACMANGIYTFRTSSKRDVGCILDGGGMVSYPWDEYHAGDDGRWNWLGQPLEEAQPQTAQLGDDLLPPFAPAGWELRVAEASHAAARREGEGSLVAEVTRVTTAGRPPSPRQTAAGVQLASPPTATALSPEGEYALTCTLTAPGAGTNWHWVALSLEAGGQLGPEQPVLVGESPRELRLTLRPSRPGPARVVCGVGAEPGEVTLDNVRLRPGCAEVFSRRFEHGLVLLNGSATRPYTFEVGPGYRRLHGRQAPEVNDGSACGTQVTVPASDGLFLVRD